MTVIAVGSEKGGCGKTSISVNLAAAAARDGWRVLLVDSDPHQQSAARWASVRHDRHPSAQTVRCVSLTAPNVTDELFDLSSHYDVVVVDTGASDSPQLRCAAIVADVLVVPFQPDELDLWTLPTMANVYVAAKRLNARLRPVLALNRVPYQMASRIPGDVKTWIAANVPDFQGAELVPLIGRSAYGRASGDGLGVTEIQPADIKAADEFNRLYLETQKNDSPITLQARHPGIGKARRR